MSNRRSCLPARARRRCAAAAYWPGRTLEDGQREGENQMINKTFSHSQGKVMSDGDRVGGRAQIIRDNTKDFEL